MLCETQRRQSPANRGRAKDVDVPVPQIQEQIVEVVKVIPQERVKNRAMEQIMDVPDP